ncbi:hypothetical protein STENM36S_02055 [Streptomyces tendae]
MRLGQSADLRAQGFRYRIALAGLLGNRVQLQPRGIAAQFLFQFVEPGVAEVAQEAPHRHRADADALADRGRGLERDAAEVLQQMRGDLLLGRGERLPATLQLLGKSLAIAFLPCQRGHRADGCIRPPRHRGDDPSRTTAAPPGRRPSPSARRTSRAPARSTRCPARQPASCRRSRRRTRWRCWWRENPPAPSFRTAPARPAGYTTRRWSSARTSPPATTSSHARHAPRSSRRRRPAAHRTRRPPPRRTPSCPAAASRPTHGKAHPAPPAAG